MILSDITLAGFKWVTCHFESSKISICFSYTVKQIYLKYFGFIIITIIIMSSFRVVLYRVVLCAYGDILAMVRGRDYIFVENVA